MYGYIYMTTNNINGKRYIGKKASEVEYEEYFGSGTYIQRALNKYGIENFSREIIEWCNSLEELNERERYWISYYNAVEDPMFYNLSPGGDGYTKGMKFSDKHKKSISESMSGENNPMYGKKPNENQLRGLEIGVHLPASYNLKKKLSEIRTGIVVSESTRKKLSDNAKGRHYINNGKDNKVVYDYEFDYYLNNGWVLGRIVNRKPRSATTNM